MIKFTIMSTAATLVLTAGSATAGNLDRSGQDIGVLFEDGDVLKFSAAYVDPSISSTATGTSDAAPGYAQLSLGYKRQIGDNLSLAVIYDQPYGASISYSDGPFAGTAGNLNSHAVTGLVRYDLGNGFGVHGGVRVQQVTGTTDSPLVPVSPALNVSSNWGVGGVVGASWEKPEIAARVALTYSSAISHTMTGTEAGAPATFNLASPQSVNLDFQTGIAANTLLFGSIRWANWTGFTIDGPNLPGAWVTYTDDVVTYSLGVGRRFNDKWSGAVTIGYERATGDPGTPLGPTDGYYSLGIGGTYTVSDSAEITAGLRYLWLGDSVVSGAPFTGNTTIAAGVSYTMTF